MESFEQYIDGAFEAGSARFDSIDPATGRVWASMPEAREADIDRKYFRKLMRKYDIDADVGDDDE